MDGQTQGKWYSRAWANRPEKPWWWWWCLWTVVLLAAMAGWVGVMYTVLFIDPHNPNYRDNAHPGNVGD